MLSVSASDGPNGLNSAISQYLQSHGFPSNALAQYLKSQPTSTQTSSPTLTQPSSGVNNAYNAMNMPSGQYGQYMGHTMHSTNATPANYGNGSRTLTANTEFSQIGNGANPNASFMGQNMPFNMAPNNPSWAPDMGNIAYKAMSTVGAIESMPEAEFYDNMNGGGYADMLRPEFNTNMAERRF